MRLNVRTHKKILSKKKARRYLLIVPFFFLLFKPTPAKAISVVPITAIQQGIYAANSGLFATSSTWSTELDLAVDLGAGIVRSNTDMMGSIWTAATTWDFTYMDQVTTAISSRGLKMYYTVPWRASWQTGDSTCQSINPYIGSGTPSTTQCPTNSLTQIRVFVTTMTTRYDSVIDTYEIPVNEPELGSATTDYRRIAAIAAEEAKAILDVNPNARISLPALSSPIRTLWQGSLTDGTTNFLGGSFHYAFLTAFASSMSYIGHNVTMSSFTTSIHPYYEANGGGQLYQTVMTTITAISAAATTNATPTIDFSEVNVAGGTPSGASSTWDVKIASDIMKAYAIMRSTNTGWAGLGGRFIVHNMAGLPISITTTSYAKTGSYKVTKRLYTGLIGYTPQGDQGDGSNVRIYKFTKGNRTFYIAWVESGTSSWPLNPSSTSVVYLTDVTGATTAQSPATFTPYTLTTSPVLVEVIPVTQAISGDTLNGTNVNLTQ